MPGSLKDGNKIDMYINKETTYGIDSDEELRASDSPEQSSDLVMPILNVLLVPTD